MKILKVLLAAPILLTVASCLAQAPAAPPASTEEQGMALAEQQYRLDRAWMQNRVSTPGTSAELRETSRENQNGKLVVRYEMTVHGAPTNKLYQHVDWPINSREPIAAMNGLSIGKNGIVMCAGRTPEQCKGNGPDDPVDFTMAPAKGELYRLALVSADQSVKVTSYVVPDPIVGKSKGCSLEAIRLTPRFELVMLKGAGFAANEDVTFLSESSGEKRDHHVKVDDKGTFDTALLPFVQGKAGGDTSVTVKVAACSPTVNFHWGT